MEVLQENTTNSVRITHLNRSFAWVILKVINVVNMSLVTLSVRQIQFFLLIRSLDQLTSF